MDRRAAVHTRVEMKAIVTAAVLLCGVFISMGTTTPAQAETRELCTEDADCPNGFVCPAPSFCCSDSGWCVGVEQFTPTPCACAPTRTPTHPTATPTQTGLVLEATPTPTPTCPPGSVLFGGQCTAMVCSPGLCFDAEGFRCVLCDSGSSGGSSSSDCSIARPGGSAPSATVLLLGALAALVVRRIGRRYKR